MFSDLSSPSGIRLLSFTPSATEAQQNINYTLQYQTVTSGSGVWQNLVLSGSNNVAVALPPGWRYITSVVATSSGGSTIGPTTIVPYYLAPTAPLLDINLGTVSFTNASASLSWNYTGMRES